MPNLAQREASKAEAQKRTSQHRRDMRDLNMGRVRLLREVAKSMDLRVYKALGQTEAEWLESIFEESVSHVLRLLATVRKLAHVPEKDLELMPEGNSYALSRLPERLKNDPAMIERAVKEKPAIFKQTALAKMGQKPEEWRTFAIRGPLSWYTVMKECEAKVAGVLELDLADQEKRATNQLTIWEAIATRVNNTPDDELRADIEGRE